MSPRHLWLYFLPLLMLPNLGFARQTAFGIVKLSDMLILPFLVLAMLGAINGRRLHIGRLTPLLLAFLCWTIMSTATVNERYGYIDDAQLRESLVHFAKYVIYGLAGVLTVRALARATLQEPFQFALLAYGVTAGVSLFFLRNEAQAFYDKVLTSGYESTNSVSVSLAMVICYTAGRFLSGEGSARWRTLAVPSSAVMVIGLLVSGGRGGWLAAFAGMLYIVTTQRLLSWRTVTYLAAGTLLVVVAYYTEPSFRREITRTLRPEEVYYASAPVEETIGGLDTGLRFGILRQEAPKLVESPILGSGFRHKGGASGLELSGSHNFWVQAFLETGIVGGTLVLLVAWRMWIFAGTKAAKEHRTSVPVKAALIAAAAAATTEVYFFSGLQLFTLFLVFAPVGALEIVHNESVIRHRASVSPIPIKPKAAAGD